VECSVASVIVIEVLAIIVGDTVALHRKAGTITLVARVGHGTRVAVVTVDVIEDRLAAAHAIAESIGALVAVVAGNRQSDALARFAVVADGAGIIVYTLSFTLVFVRATRLPRAGVGCTVVSVVAVLYVFPIHQTWLVHLSVAIVIKTVALFRRGGAGVTIGEPLVGADPLAGAGARLVGYLARGEQGPFG